METDRRTLIPGSGSFSSIVMPVLVSIATASSQPVMKRMSSASSVCEDSGMLIAQIEIAQLLQGHATIRSFCCHIGTSVQICRLIQVSLEFLFLIRSNVVDFAIDLLAILARRM